MKRGASHGHKEMQSRKGFQVPAGASCGHAVARLDKAAGRLCSEKDAAVMCRTIVKVIGHCHSLGVMHRRERPPSERHGLVWWKGPRKGMYQRPRKGSIP